MSKFQRSPVKLVVRHHTSIKEMTAARARRPAKCAAELRVDELGDISVSISKMRDELLDYNPVLSVMAEALQKAVALEIESQRCSLMFTADRA
jgi:hypothetical protein